MFGSKCLHCIQSSSKVYSVSKLPQNVLHYNRIVKFCTKAKVPQDVFKSKVSEHSGTKSSTFESEPIQTILKRMRSLNLDKVFASRREELTKPTYQLFDLEEIKQEEEKIIEEAEKRLRMPEIRGLRKPINIIISEDPELIQNDEDEGDYVFTDISSSEDFRSRGVNVRENSTGILREANWDERDRMQHIYWPKEGQTYELAPMLLDENLLFSFDQFNHEHVLDFINIQCEVDSPDYLRVTQSAYEDLAKREAFDVLKSTRYYGGMIFYFVTNKKTSSIFSSFIRNGLHDDAADIVRLHSLIHQDFQCAVDDNEQIIHDYINRNNLNDLLQYLSEQHISVSQ